MLLIIIVQQIIVVRLKIRSLIVNRFNEFHLTDILTICQVILGVTFLIMGAYLFSSKVNEGDFMVVLSSEDDFDRWIIWSEDFTIYRIVLGIYSIV